MDAVLPAEVTLDRVVADGAYNSDLIMPAGNIWAMQDRMAGGAISASTPASDHASVQLDAVGYIRKGRMYAFQSKHIVVSARSSRCGSRALRAAVMSRDCGRAESNRSSVKASSSLAC
jgi:hypothetical protein